MKAADWIDRVKMTRGWESDYRVAKELDVSRSTISGYRSKIPTFDEDTSIKVAAALGLPAAGVILDQVAERTKNPLARIALEAEAKRLCILCKVATARKTIATGARPTWAIAGFH